MTAPTSEEIILREMREVINRNTASLPSDRDVKRTLGLCFSAWAEEYARRFGYEAVKQVLIHAQRHADEKTIRGQLVYALDELLRDE